MKNKLTTEHQTTSSEVQVEVESHPKTATLLGEDIKLVGVAVTRDVDRNLSDIKLDKAFDEMVEDATRTQEQVKTEKRELKEEKPYTPELAAGVALTGLAGVMKLVGKFTNAPLVVEQETQMIFAAMCTPLVLKYGKTIKSLLNPENVDLNSNVPEYLALAAVGVIALPSYLQVKEYNKLNPPAESKPAPEKTTEVAEVSESKEALTDGSQQA